VELGAGCGDTDADVARSGDVQDGWVLAVGNIQKIARADVSYVDACRAPHCLGTQADR
jgi:hypothetical protein